MKSLFDRVVKAISAIPASNPGYISMYPETLDLVLSEEIIRKIAKVAIDVVKDKQ
jgi:hypothetical protein